ncbi:MAG: hypothetical protein J6B87_00240 [Clostridia bacterium]|nr:hypothetical protein [Clostridia bacterium]
MKRNKIKVIYILLVLFAVLLSLCTTTYASNAVIEGNGSEKKPYILNFDYATPVQGGGGKYIEIGYVEEANFWFQIHESNSAGTYAVEYDKTAKKVKITYINNNNIIYYPRNAESEFYTQAGTKSIAEGTAVEPELKDCTFIIQAKEDTIGNAFDKQYFWSFFINENGTSVASEYRLKNTFMPGSNIHVQHPCYFVFVPTKGTVKDLYKEASIEVCTGSTYNHIRYNGKYAEYVIDSRVPTWALLKNDNNIIKNYPTKVVRFGSWNGGAKTESNISDTEKHKLEIKYHFIASDIEPEEKAGVIETAITKILLGIGDVFIAITKAFLGDDVTMDSIIFNRYEGTVIDFRGRTGFLANTEVKKIINGMYRGFELLAIVVNIVILLYLGIQIVVNIGGEKQSKYSKNLQNWVVGVIILFIAPRFFPYLTDVSNVIVGYIGSAVSPYVTQYNILVMLDDDALLGEDAETVDLEEKIETGITTKTEQRDEILAEIAEYESTANEQYNIVMNFGIYINDMIEELYDDMFARGDITLEEAEEKKNNARARLNFEGDIDEITYYLKSVRSSWTSANDVEFQKKINEFQDTWRLYLNYEKRPNCKQPECVLHPMYHYVVSHSRECNDTTIRPVREAIKFIYSYKELQLECGKLEKQILTLDSYDSTKDLMGEMRVKAGQTGRATYAIIWFILFFQLISLLALYYKRIIMVVILIMIFPIVMITYAIDKIGDGSAQTLETWTKEFTVNITVQIAHAIVYVTLIQTGLSFYEADPNNWLFFIIAVLCLFPLERLIRTMFGMNGGTIDSLKSNVLGGTLAAIGAARMAYKGGKAAVRGGKNVVNGVKNATQEAKKLASDIKQKGIKETAKNRYTQAKKRIKEDLEKEYKTKDQKAKKRQSVADRKKRTRDSNIQLRQKQMQNASAAKKAWLKTVNAASMVRNGMYYAGNAGRKIKGVARKPLVRYAGKNLKALTNTARRVGGAAVGAISGATNTIMAGGKGAGLVGSVAQGTKIGNDVKSIVAGNNKKQAPKQPKQAPKSNVVLPSTSRKNMPGGQKYKKAPVQPKGRVSAASTRDRRMKQQIKGTKTLRKTTNKKTIIKEENKD